MNSQTVFDATTKTWSGVGTIPQIDSKVSIGSIVLKALAKFPDKIGQISDNNDVQMTNGEIHWRTIRAAQNLTKFGICSNDVIQVISKNHHYLAPIIFAALTVGAPVNALDVQFTKGEILHMLQLIKPKVIICDNGIIGNVKAALQELQIDLPIFTIDGCSEGAKNIEVLFDETESLESFEPPSLDDANKHPAVIVCTSGSTGLPKGVCLSHSALMAACTKAGLLPEDVMLNFSSLYWLTGWGTLLMTSFQSATRIITTQTFTSEIWLRIVEKYKVTVTLTPPHYLAMILQDKNLDTTDISSLKAYFCTGGMVSNDLCDRMNKRLTKGYVVVSYAMSETAGFISINTALRSGSVGQLLPGYSAKIIDENGENCGVDVDGEICFKPSYKFIGYYGDAENTKKTMDKDGWIRTGDVGHFDNEGFLYLIDRKKEILKYFGNQVSPSELENILMKHPGVSNVCIIGIPDPLAGDLPTAVIMKSPTGVSEEEINLLMKEQLSDAKQLRGGIYFVDSLPVTPSGKVLRRKVLEIAMKLNAEVEK